AGCLLQTVEQRRDARLAPAIAATADDRHRHEEDLLLAVPETVHDLAQIIRARPRRLPDAAAAAEEADTGRALAHEDDDALPLRDQPLAAVALFEAPQAGSEKTPGAQPS